MCIRDRCRDVNCDVFACFVDYQKAFGQVQWQKMMDILENIGLEGNDTVSYTHLDVYKRQDIELLI